MSVAVVGGADGYFPLSSFGCCLEVSVSFLNV